MKNVVAINKYLEVACSMPPLNMIWTCNYIIGKIWNWLKREKCTLELLEVGRGKDGRSLSTHDLVSLKKHSAEISLFYTGELDKVWTILLFQNMPNTSPSNLAIFQPFRCFIQTLSPSPVEGRDFRQVLFLQLKFSDAWVLYQNFIYFLII